MMTFEIYRLVPDTSRMEYVATIEAEDLGEAEDIARHLDPFDPHLERLHVQQVGNPLR